MIGPAVRTPKGARRAVVGIVVCVLVLLVLGAVVIRTYTLDRTEDQDQIGALEQAVNTLADQLKQEGVEPVVESAQEVDPSAPVPPLPGRDGRDGSDGRDGTNPPCLSTPTRCQGADGISGAVGGNGADGANGVDGVNGNDGLDGTNGVDGANGQNGQDSTVPGPEGPPCPAGTTGGFVPAPLPSTGTWWVCAQDAP